MEIDNKGTQICGKGSLPKILTLSYPKCLPLHFHLDQLIFQRQINVMQYPQVGKTSDGAYMSNIKQTLSIDIKSHTCMLVVHNIFFNVHLIHQYDYIFVQRIILNICQIHKLYINFIRESCTGLCIILCVVLQCSL